MIRLSREHPFDRDYWWTENGEYMQEWVAYRYKKVDPTQDLRLNGIEREWIKWPTPFHKKTRRDGREFLTYFFEGDPADDDFQLYWNSSAS